MFGGVELPIWSSFPRRRNELLRSETEVRLRRTSVSLLRSSLRRRGNELQIGSSTPPNITGLEDRRPGRLNKGLGDVVGERDLDRLTSDVSDREVAQGGAQAVRPR